MTTKNAAAADHDWAAPRFKGKTFAIKGKFRYDIVPKRISETIQSEGGQLVKEVTATVHFLIIGDKGGAAGARQQAEQLNYKKGAAIQIIDEAGFFSLLRPTRAAAMAMLVAGPKGIERFNHLLSGDPSPRLDLRRIDLRRAKLAGVHLPSDADLGGADLRDADLQGAHLGDPSAVNFAGACLDGAGVPAATRCCFDRASLQDADLGKLKRCSLVKADLTRAQAHDLLSCDCADARLHQLRTHFGKNFGSTFKDTIFRAADLSEAALTNCNCQECDFTGCDLRKAQLVGANLTRTKLAGANLAGANLAKAKLVDADLTGADLTGANLAGANLAKARIHGADFTGALLDGATVRGLDVRKAKGFNPSSASSGGKAGPCIKKLDALVGKALDKLTFSIMLDLPEGPIKLEVAKHYLRVGQGDNVSLGDYGSSFRDLMVDMTRRWAHGKPRLDSVSVAAKPWPLPRAELHALILAGWCEAFGVPVPSAEASAGLAKPSAAKAGDLREALLAELRGADGAKKWMARPKHQRQQLSGNVDLADANLDGADFSLFNFKGANFDRASLAKCNLGSGTFDGATFRDANLTGADGWCARFRGALFCGANLSTAKFWKASLRSSAFKTANLRGTNLSACDLRGADLSSALLEDTNLDYARFDEHTRFPPGFTPPKKMRWAGAVADPRKQQKVAGASPSGFGGFLKRLAARVESDRLKKALLMLKADRFQLFAQTDNNSVVGIVKSQSDAALVYSCRLANDGTYGCCTQNLNICGGLRGALCKHLLVLIVALTKAGQLDPATVDKWIKSSMGRKPALDKDAMSQTLLRYKGAEAGEVDWRPTETIPEDYYALG
jgi:uncharacterized protein YjbI with pentapeptide repeats